MRFNVKCRYCCNFLFVSYDLGVKNIRGFLIFYTLCRLIPEIHALIPGIMASIQEILAIIPRVLNIYQRDCKI